LKHTKIVKALSILFVVVVALTGAFYFFGPPLSRTKFSTSYQDYPDPAHRPEQEPQQIVQVSGVIRYFDISKDESKIAIATSKELDVYDLETLERVHTFPVTESVTRIEFSPDGSQLAARGSILGNYQSGHMFVTIWDTSSWQPVYRYESETDDYYYQSPLAWSPDGRQIAFHIPERGLSIVNVATGEIAATLKDFNTMPFDISWSPDGKRIIAAGDYGNGIRRWRLDTDKWVRLWNSEMQPASQAKWSPDGRKIASGHYGGTLCIWNVRNNSCEGDIQAHFNWVGSLDWSPDGGEVASASGAIRIWDASSGEMKSAFGLYDGVNYTELQWVDAQTLVTLEEFYTERSPSTIRFWDVSSGNETLAFRGWDNDQGYSSGGIMLVLDDIQVGADHTLIQVSLRFDTAEYSMAGNWNLTMKDSASRVYPLTDVTPPEMDHSLARIYQTVPLVKGKHITLDLTSFPPQQGLPMLMDTSASPGNFTFDPARLKVGESLSSSMEVATNIGLLHLMEVQRPSPADLVFVFNSENMYNGIGLSSPLASMSASNPLVDGLISATLSFNEMPDQPIDINVTKVFYQGMGSWVLDFQVAESMFAELPPVQGTVPSPEPQPEAGFTSQDPLFLEAQSLIERNERSIIQAGWLHLKSVVVAENLQPGQVYPPPYYEEDQWFEVDAAGQVLRSLTTDLDQAGNVIQQSAVVGTHSLNLTTGEVMEVPAQLLPLDVALADLDYALSHEHIVSREETSCDDASPCLVLTLKDGIFARRIWINMETGQQVKMQALEFASDGTEIVQYTQTFLPVEWSASPPMEVQEVFDKVVIPTS